MQASIAEIVNYVRIIRSFSDFELAFAGRLYTFCIIND